jgi:hypothetical protein
MDLGEGKRDRGEGKERERERIKQWEVEGKDCGVKE